jgi:hypothetical protein
MAQGQAVIPIAVAPIIFLRLKPLLPWALAAGNTRGWCARWGSSCRRNSLLGRSLRHGWRTDAYLAGHGTCPLQDFEPCDRGAGARLHHSSIASNSSRGENRAGWKEVNENVDGAVEAAHDTSSSDRDLLSGPQSSDPRELETIRQMVVLNVRNRDEITKTGFVRGS